MRHVSLSVANFSHISALCYPELFGQLTEGIFEDENFCYRQFSIFSPNMCKHLGRPLNINERKLASIIVYLTPCEWKFSKSAPSQIIGGLNTADVILLATLNVICIWMRPRLLNGGITSTFTLFKQVTLQGWAGNSNHSYQLFLSSTCVDAWKVHGEHSCGPNRHKCDDRNSLYENSVEVAGIEGQGEVSKESIDRLLQLSWTRTAAEYVWIVPSKAVIGTQLASLIAETFTRQPYAQRLSHGFSLISVILKGKHNMSSCPKWRMSVVDESTSAPCSRYRDIDSSRMTRSPNWIHYYQVAHNCTITDGTRSDSLQHSDWRARYGCIKQAK